MSNYNYRLDSYIHTNLNIVNVIRSTDESTNDGAELLNQRNVDDTLIAKPDYSDIEQKGVKPWYVSHFH